MKHLAAIALILALSACVSVSAWVRSPAKGRVVDAESGLPITSAKLKTEDGESLGVTGPDGTFSVPAKRGKTTVFLLAANDIVERTVLVISADGYETLRHALPLGHVVSDDAEPASRPVGDIKLMKAPNKSPEATPGKRPPLPPSSSSGAPQL
jgi:hypothetical protein